MINDNALKLSKFEEDNIKDVIKHILNKYADLNKHDQYALFLEICEISLLKNEFFEYRDNIKVLMKKDFDIQNLSMEYHVSSNLPRTHLKILNSQIKKYFYWEQRFETESKKEFPNDYLLKVFSEMMDDTALLIAKFNMGTPIMVYVQRRLRNSASTKQPISLKSFGEMGINKYDKDSSKEDSVINGKSTAAETGFSIPNSSSSDEGTGHDGSNGGSVRLPESSSGQRLQTGSESSGSQGGSEATQGTGDITETEEVF